MNPYGRNRLPFPYSYVLDLTFSNDVSIGGAVPPTRNDCNLVILQLDDTTLFKLTSAMQAGLDLIYPNEWQTLMDWWNYAYAYANTGKFVSCEGDQLLDICELVADCVRNNTDVQNAINEIINIDNPDLPSTPVPLPALQNELDCIWGASVDAYELVLDGWEVLKVIIDGGASLIDVLQPIKEVVGTIPLPPMEIFEFLLDTGTAVADAYLNLQATQDEWACALFKCVVANGRPYTLTPSCMVQAMNTLTPFPSDPVFDAFGDTLTLFTGFNTLLSYWLLRSDDSCNNDWETLCSFVCGASLPNILDWGDPRIASITINGNPVTTTPGQQGFVLPASWSPLVVTFDKVYCGVDVRSVVSRGATVSEPNQFNWEFGAGSGQITIGAFGDEDFVIPLGNNVGDTLTITNVASNDLAPWAWQLANISSPGIAISQAD